MSLFPSSWMVSPLWSWNGVSGVLRTIFLLKQSPTWAMYPRRLVGIGCLRLERLPLQRGEIDPVEYWGSSGTWLTLFEISQVYRSMCQCEIQARQVSGQEPDFSKMTNLAEKKPLLVFFNSQTGGTGHREHQPWRLSTGE